VRRGGFTTGVGLWVGVLLLACSGCGGSTSHGSAATQKGAATYRRVATNSGTIKYLGGPHGIVSDKLPSGSAFSISGQRYLFMGHHHLEVRVHFADPAQIKEGGSNWSQGSGGLEWGAQTGCEGHPFVIVYGLLRAPNDSAFTRISGKLIEYRKAALPASLHTNGALFYGTSSSSVGGLTILSPTGQPLANQSSGLIIEPSGGVCSHHQGTPAALNRFPHLLNRLPRLRSAVAQIAQCMRRQGFDVTGPNTSKRGPLLNTHGINTGSARYMGARRACGKEVLRGLRGSGNGR
jgi:hypothetical protein